MSDENLTIQLIEELRKSNNSMQELKQLIPRLENVEKTQNRLYKEVMVHQAVMRPEDFKMLSDKVHSHDKQISIIQSELGISQKEIQNQKDGMKTFFARAWDIFKTLATPGSVIYLILEIKGVI